MEEEEEIIDLEKCCGVAEVYFGSIRLFVY